MVRYRSRNLLCHVFVSALCHAAVGREGANKEPPRVITTFKPNGTCVQADLADVVASGVAIRILRDATLFAFY